MDAVRLITVPEETVTIVLYNRFPRKYVVGNQKLGELTQRIRRIPDSKTTPEGEEIIYNPDKSIGYNMATFVVPKRIARELLFHRKDRYYLYNSEPIEAQVPGPNGTSKWITYNPWYFVVSRIQVGNDPETTEVKFKDKITWHEDIDGKKYYKDKKSKLEKNREIAREAETAVVAMPTPPERPFELVLIPGRSVNDTIAQIREICEKRGIDEEQWKKFEKGEREKVGRGSNSFNKNEFPIVVRNYEEFIRDSVK